MAMKQPLLVVDRLVAAYNMLLVGLWAALLPRASYALWLLVAHAAAVLVPHLLARAPSTAPRLVRTLRELYPLLFLPLFWVELDLFRTLLHQTANDGAIAAFDLAVFGIHIHAVWMPAMPQVWLSEVMHFFYYAYYALIFIPPLVVAFAGLTPVLRDITLRLMLTYLACYLVYIAFPVDGPHYLMTQYEGPLTDGFFYQLVRDAQEAGDSQGCAFPSSHVAGAVTIAYLGWRWFSRVVAILLTAEAVGVFFSTVYTQNHYAIDAVAGVVFALALQTLLLPVLSRWLAPRPLRPLVPVLPAFRSPPATPRTTGGGT